MKNKWLPLKNSRTIDPKSLGDLKMKITPFGSLRIDNDNDDEFHCNSLTYDTLATGCSEKIVTKTSYNRSYFLNRMI